MHIISNLNFPHLIYLANLGQISDPHLLFLAILVVPKIIVEYLLKLIDFQLQIKLENDYILLLM